MISVCIATYNGGKYIKAQLESILVQLSENDEVVISDDNSSDNTIAIIDSLRDPRIKLIKHQQFGSPVYNFENALNHASGDIIFLSDQDDIWHENKVSIIIPYFARYDVVVSDCTIVNEVQEVISPSFFMLNRSSRGLVNNLLNNSYLGCCMAFKRAVLKKALPFPQRIPMHDIWLGFITEMFFKSVFIPEQLVSYRRHSNNASSASESSKYQLLQKILFRWNLIKHIPRLLLK